MYRNVRRAGMLAGTAAAAMFLLAGPASAHVTVQPPTAAAGSYATLSFKVPTEKDTASTTGLDVQLPTDTPIASVSVQPKAGWTYKITKAAPSKPLMTDDGEVKEIVTRIAWTAQGDGGIKPGEFDTFTVSAGPLPENTDHIVFKALQTYSDGSVVRWVDVAAPGAQEPEKPAPVLTLTASSPRSGGPGAAAARSDEAASASDDSDGTARGLGIAGLVLGALGLLAGGFALISLRRRA
ncbi:hypothetical protein CcI156_20530 [Frankia sp. CcI156]|uniref:YcnI family copper-binding membrane protein n=1 Tax=unclassified Frankia TaxID=2632575 RepID=UPI0003D023F8|nr:MULTISPECIES: YcnI family protein [unclassified Frankia]ETA00912.1 hypothetical protein CcI6DRAFT_03674 [Frankia sp. CcI6]KFB02994.1 hypothetical protein ALLO2DRAFT_04265 [Frankia sp. Allo2]OHV50465.1 hypothetical protein CgIS1_20240 [Frankia sp. CgIS1]ONH22737.1 hypothetical protein CcI156_20530 [Frankia sp. CcI156]